MVEKGFDLAKDFLGKLIGPTVEEIGLLAKDQVTLWKLKNQIKILNKAKTYCEQNSISTKVISLKILCPLLDNAALEEDEILQDRWANLLGNMVDSDQNIDNHVFPYLLSQISTNEFKVLEQVLTVKNQRITDLNNEIKELDQEYKDFLITYTEERIMLEKEIKLRSDNNITNPRNYIPIHGLQNSLRSNQFKKDLLTEHKSDLTNSLTVPQLIDEKMLKEYELSNLIRLGIIKSVAKSYIRSEPLEIPNEPDEKSVIVDLEIEIHQDYDDHILTQLGELFIKACSEKRGTHGSNHEAPIFGSL